MTRPVFYWFSDCWHSHIPNRRNHYLYIFVKNPKKDNLSLRSRHGDLGFDSLYKHYLRYRKIRKTKKANMAYHKRDYSEYCEPAILMSFSKIKPDLSIIFLNEKDRFGLIVEPLEYQGEMVEMFEEDYTPIAFNNISIINKILPELFNSIPFVKPVKKEGRYEYKDWVPMVTDKMGTWL